MGSYKKKNISTNISSSTGNSLVTKSKLSSLNVLDIISNKIKYRSSNIPLNLRNSIEEIVLKSDKAANSLIDFISERITDPYIEDLIPICNNSCLDNNCVLKKSNIIPKGKKCPIKYILALNLKNRYMEIINKAIIDSGEDMYNNEVDIVTLKWVNQLVECDIMEMIVNQEIAINGIFQENIALIAQKSEEIYSNRDISPSIKIKQYIDSRRNEILENLLMTPKIKEKLKVRNEIMTNIMKIVDLDKKIEESITVIDVEVKDENREENEPPLTASEYDEKYRK